MQGAGMVLGSRLVRPFTAFSQDSASDRAQHRLPVTDSHYKRVRSYIEDEPVPEYRWAFDAAYGPRAITRDAREPGHRANQDDQNVRRRRPLQARLTNFVHPCPVKSSQTRFSGT